MMPLSNNLRVAPVIKRVLVQGRGEQAVLHQHTCLRCGNTWWPRRPSKPLRCPNCKSPYWDRPRRVKASRPVDRTPLKREDLKDSLRVELGNALGLGTRESNAHEDRSLAKALAVLRAMKAAGRTWQEMAERVEREFGSKLDKDQLKALVR